MKKFIPYSKIRSAVCFSFELNMNYIQTGTDHFDFVGTSYLHMNVKPILI